MTDVTASEATTSRASAAPARQTLAGAVARGRRQVLAELPGVEHLATRLEVPVTARSAWIRAQLDAERGVEPWAVQVRSARGELLAAAVVLDDEHGARLAGGGGGHRGAVVAVDDDAAAALGRCVADEADRRGHRGVCGVLHDDPRVRAFAAGAGALVTPAPPVPALLANAERELADRLSHGMLRTLRKARNRLDGDRRAAHIVVTRRGEEVVAALPGMERVYRASDERHGVADGGGCDEVALWRARIRRLLEQRALELTALTVDGQLAAYVLGVRDSGWYRILDGRMESAFARYAPGRVVEAAVIAQALSTGVAGVDWMTSVAPETLLAADALQPVVTITPGR